MEARRKRLLLFTALGGTAFLIVTFFVVRGATHAVWRSLAWRQPRARSTLSLPASVAQPGRRGDSFARVLDQLGQITSHPHAECSLSPAHQARYARIARAPDTTILISAILTQAEAVLPTFIAELTTLAAFVGGRKLHVTIHENGSSDESPRLLGLLARALDGVGATYTIVSRGSAVTASYGPDRRIAMLAALRNGLLETLADPQVAPALRGFAHLVMLNDVHFCAADALELVYQREQLDAVMTAGLDYEHLELAVFERTGYPLTFRDVWVANDMGGKCVDPWVLIGPDDRSPAFNISEAGHWTLPSPPFALDKAGSARRDALLPFQVFSSWNGIVAIDPAVFRPPHSIRFRTVEDGGDRLSECWLLCRDLWHAGLGRIAVVPRVRVGYSLEAHLGARKDTALSRWILSDDEQAAMDTSEWIEWEPRPPTRVRTFPYGNWAEGTWIDPL